MAQSRNDYQSFRTANSPYLHPDSRSFGFLDGREIERSFLVAGRTLNAELLSLIDALASGSLSLRGFVARSKAVIFRSYYIAYSLGAISIFPFYTMTDRDVRILSEELEEETGFLRSFGRDIRSDGLVLDPVQRARLYMLGLRGIFERGRVEAMPPGPYRWRLGITEHCLECQAASYEGPYQRDRTSGLGLPPLPGAPGDGSVCLGLTRCGCTIELANGIPLPNADLADRLRGLLLEVSNGPRTNASGSAID